MKLLSKIPFESAGLPTQSDSKADRPSINKIAETGLSYSNIDTITREHRASRYLQPNVNKLMKDIDAACNFPIQCLQPEQSLHQESVELCRRCLSKLFGSVVIAANKHQTHSVYVFFEREKEIPELSVCRANGGAIKVMKITDSECHLRFTDQFLSFPVGDQFLAPMSRVRQRNLLYFPPEPSSGCI